MTYRTNPAQFQIAYATNGRDLLLERESLIERDTKVAYCVGKPTDKTMNIF